MKKKKRTIAIINGPNLNVLGKREPGIYGNETLEQILEGLKEKTKDSINIKSFQSNFEGELVEYIQNCVDAKIDGIIINPAAFTKTSYAILEALNYTEIPFIEVHLSNIYSRGGWHAESIFSENAMGCIVGFQGLVYELGVTSFLKYFNTK
jgi:3-dehydroquinate dehydratase-2